MIPTTIPIDYIGLIFAAGMVAGMLLIWYYYIKPMNKIMKKLED